MTLFEIFDIGGIFNEFFGGGKRGLNSILDSLCISIDLKVSRMNLFLNVMIIFLILPQTLWFTT